MATVAQSAKRAQSGVQLESYRMCCCLMLMQSCLVTSNMCMKSANMQKDTLIGVSDSSEPRRSAQHTLPSSVTAAKTVAECGDQAASPTGLFKSNDMTGLGLSPSHSFSVQSADADRKMRVCMLFHLTAYTVMSCPACCPSSINTLKALSIHCKLYQYVVSLTEGHL